MKIIKLNGQEQQEPGNNLDPDKNYYKLIYEQVESVEVLVEANTASEAQDLADQATRDEIINLWDYESNGDGYQHMDTYQIQPESLGRYRTVDVSQDIIDNY